jgi:hypothetical protein
VVLAAEHYNGTLPTGSKNSNYQEYFPYSLDHITGYRPTPSAPTLSDHLIEWSPSLRTAHLLQHKAISYIRGYRRIKAAFPDPQLL